MDPISQAEFAWAEKYNALQAENATLRSENYAEKAATKAFMDASTYATGLVEKLAGVVSDLTKTAIETNKEVAVIKSDIKYISAMNEKDHKSIIHDYQGAIALESERRVCGEKGIYDYVRANYVPGALIMPASSICPPVVTQCGQTTASPVVAQR